MNQEEQRFPDRRQQQNPTKHLLIIICIYLILYIFNSESHSNQSGKENLIKLLNDEQNMNISVSNILQSFRGHMEGKWISDSPKSTNNFLWKDEGKFSYSITQKKKDEFDIILVLKNGEYIDDGIIRIAAKNFKTHDWEKDREGKSVSTFPNETQNEIKYEKQIVFQTIQEGEINITKKNLSFQVTLDHQNRLTQKIFLLGLTGESTINMTVLEPESKFFGSMILALILFVIAYTEFFSIMSILQSIIEGEEDANNFSFLTILLSLLWDSVLCIIAFSKAFSSEDSSVTYALIQENLILFIVPAFIFCLLFANLDLRLMLQIYRRNQSDNANLRNVLCKFNIITYGCLFSLFPILYVVNFSNILYVALSLIYLPQIYTNAKIGKRPNIKSPYYHEFLLFRFLIIFYIKCLPFNIFEIEPNYFLGVGCLALVVCQFGLLWIQKTYGPKTVLPKFLLPPIFDYNVNSEEIMSEKIENQNQCSICLNNLTSKPTEVHRQLSPPCEVMKTPCGHSFHGMCLVNWMNIKKQCPQCRGKLPAYE